MLNERLLACPHDGSALRLVGDALACEQQHNFPVEHGIPILARNPRREPRPLNMAPCAVDPSSPVDPFVNDWIVNTNGNLYWRVRGKLPSYPIPVWPLPGQTGADRVLVDLGCGWGRWCIAAARIGFSPCGVDVHVDALQAASRVAAHFGLACDFLCSEIDRLPFRDDSVDFVFSYSVLQHLSRERVRRVLAEVRRILRPGGSLLIQLPNTFGALSILQQARRGFREAREDSFEMRYWTPVGIRRAFRDAGFAAIALRTDGFFSQNPQPTDLPLLSACGRLVVRTSHFLAAVANRVAPLTRLADSLLVTAQKPF
ncbi:MAG TPA: class I SAM-dependent methyltransferase [Dongiaceae bacterium]|nr:class I SAM-dependent methyltransferase [Dongiaceae bacterium]